MAETLAETQDAEERILNIRDFFLKFSEKIETHPFELKCKYCDYRFGADSSRFMYHLACIPKRGVRVCNNAPLLVQFVSRSLLNPPWKNINASAKSVSDAVRAALNMVATEFDTEFAPEDELAQHVMESLAPDDEKINFRGCIELPFKGALLLEKAIADHPTLWPPEGPQRLWEGRYCKLCEYLNFVLIHYGTRLDKKSNRVLDRYVEYLLKQGFAPHAIYGIATTLRNNDTVDLGLKILMEDYKKLKIVVEAKREDLQKLEKQMGRVCRLLQDHKIDRMRF